MTSNIRGIECGGRLIKRGVKTQLMSHWGKNRRQGDLSAVVQQRTAQLLPGQFPMAGL